MRKIATLGPANTFSELAAIKYGEQSGQGYSVDLYPTIGKAFAAVGRKCSCAVLPIENMAEGYVSIVLDLLVHSDLTIVQELLLPIRFSLAANCSALDQVDKVYVQFVTQGQCESFLDRMEDISVITTQSNGKSLEQLQRGLPSEAAVVPSFAVKTGDFPLVIPDIADRSNNRTRFIAIAPQPAAYDPALEYKTTLLIVESVDRPGILSYILSAFAARNVNLVSIMSRPTKEMLGRYNFFIDVEGHFESPLIQEALSEVRKKNTVRVLGSFVRSHAVVEMPLAAGAGKKIAGSLQPSPFPCDSFNPGVYIAAGRNAYENTREVLERINIAAVRGKRVLLKPNAGRIASNGCGVTTNPRVVAAAIDAFREAGADVAVGESPITGVKMHEAFETTGIAAVARERDCPLLDMDAGRPVDVNIKDGVAVKTLNVCPEVFEYDVIVSIPVMKTHMHTGVTLSVKNMKGCLWRRSKVDLHMLPQVEGIDEIPLNIAIADMASVLRPHLAIIDGTTGMEGLGPSAGKAKKLGVVLAGVDAFAVDAVACSLMGLNAYDVPHLRIGSLRGYGVIDVTMIKVSPDSWRDLSSPFELPPDNLSIQFPGITMLDEQSCSACQSTVLMFLNRHGKQVFDYLPGQENVTIAIGKGHASVPQSTLCIGNCTSEHKDRGIFISGCPPVASQILKALSDHKPAKERG